MELTLEQKTRALGKLGMKPWEADFQFNPDGTVELVPTPTEDRNPVSVGLRRTLHSGAAAPLAAVAGTAAAKAAQPVIAPIAAGAAALTTPVGGAVVEGLGTLGAFGAGAMGGGMLYEKTYGPRVRKFASGSEAQQLRDETEHPIASFIGDTAGNLAGFQLNNPKAVLSTLGKAARLRNLFQRDLSLTTAEKAAMRNIGTGTVASGGIEAGRQLASDQEMDPAAIVKAAAQGAILGAPRGTPATGSSSTATGLAGLGESLGGIFQRKKPPVASAPAPATPEAPPPEAPPVMSAPDIMPPDPVSLMGENLGLTKPDRAETVMPTQMTSADPAMGPLGLPKPLMTPRQPEAFFPPGFEYPAASPEAPLRAPGGAFMMPGRARPLALPAPAEGLGGDVNTPGPRGTVSSIQREVQRPLTTADVEVLAQRLMGNQISNPNKKARRPELRPANPEDRVLPIEGPRTEAETLQDWIENRRAKYQEIPKADAADAPMSEPVRAAADPVDVETGRQALRRRGFEFSETDQPILTETGGEARGVFDPVTGKIQVSKTQADETTHLHEGAHGELQSMMLSGNPRVAKLAYDMLRAANEETVVDLAARAGLERAKTNPLVKIIKDNWDYLKTTKLGSLLGGRDQSPERLARLLAERFETQAPSKVPTSVGDPKYARLSAEQEHVPMSVIASVAKVSPEAGRAVQDAFALKDKIFGENFNAPIYNLGKQHSREVIDSAIWKRSRAGQLKTAPVFTPEEAVINAVYDKIMKDTADLATKNGFPIKPLNNYVPELISTDLARDFERNPVEFLRTRMPEFHTLNQRIYGASYDPVEGAAYAQEYLKGVAKAPNSLGSDFGALTKYKREYHLPDTWREVDQLRNLERYGERYSRQLARRIAVDSNPQVAQMLGYPIDPALGLPSTVLDVPEAMQNARKALDGVLINEGRGTSGIGQDTKDLFTATQQLAYSSSMQTLSGLRNSLQKMPMHLIQARNQGELDSLMQSTFKTLNEFETQLQKAVSMNVVRPGRDPNAVDSSSLRVRMAHRIQEAAVILRKATGADFLETFNRVHDYTIGEGLAEINLKLVATKDPDALAFIKRFGAGVDDSMPYDEQIALMARNYAIAMQSSYSAEGLPAPMLKGGAVGQLTRIQRFGFENMNRVRQMVIEPARQGNYQPLLTYLAGTVLTAPVLIKLTEALSGRPSSLPSQEEIEAGKKSPLLENVFNIMSLAQITGAFGLAGGTAGALANNARGNPQSVLGDPIIGFGTGLITNLGAAVEAIRQGEPAIPVITEAVERALLNNMQLYRGITVDRDEAQDVRNKRLFEYLTEQREVTVPDMISGALGISGRRTAKISPTKSAAQEGDKEARAAIPTDQHRALDNYKGGFEDPRKERAYRKFLRQTQGIEAEKAYLARRKAFKAQVAGAE